MVEASTADRLYDVRINGINLNSIASTGDYFSDDRSRRASLISSAADYETAPTTPVMSRHSLSTESVNTISGNNKTPVKARPDQIPKRQQPPVDDDAIFPGAFNPLPIAPRFGINGNSVVHALDGRALTQEESDLDNSTPNSNHRSPPFSALRQPLVKEPEEMDNLRLNDESELPPSPPVSTESREPESPTSVIGQRRGSATPSDSRSSHEGVTVRPRQDSGQSLLVIAETIASSSSRPLTSIRPQETRSNLEPFTRKHPSEVSITFSLGPPLKRASTTDERTQGTSRSPHPPPPHAVPYPEAHHYPTDMYLSPPSITFTPSATAQQSSQVSPAKRAKRRNTYSTPPTPTAPEEREAELDDDILALATQIRRERTTKRERAEREKAQQDAEVYGLVRQKSWGRRDDKPLVGNLVGEGHVNYVLMYNMLTGIRIAVSRCQGKIKRQLTDEDFTAKHKYSFDITGGELTPSAKYDFKFKDYAPWVFRQLREEYFNIDPADYLLSLTAKYILSELGSPGKSGSFFYFSRDYRFIIKTIHHGEHKFLRSILRQYLDHVKANPHTLLSRFYGLHRVKLPRGRKIHFVIMNNLFPPHKDIHETYDLKGSTVGREYPEGKARENPGAVMKDINWLHRRKTLELGPEKKAFLTEQLRRDVALLQHLNVMDYSLLVGIHELKRGNRDNVRSNTLKMFSPGVPHPRRRGAHTLKGSIEANAMRRAIRGSVVDPNRLGSVESSDLPDDLDDRKPFIFYSDDGGYRASDEQNHPMDSIYYFGIIDICTRYTVVKKLEHLWKGLSSDSHKISSVPAVEYGQRFLRFLTGVMRGGSRSEFIDQYVKGKEKTEEPPEEHHMVSSFSEPHLSPRVADMSSPHEMEKSLST